LHPAGGEVPLLSHLLREEALGKSRERGRLTREALLAVEPGERQKLLESYLQQEVARSLRLDPSQLDLQQSLDTVGLDSLMGLELKNRIESDLGVALPIATLMQDPSISQLATRLLALLTEPSSPSSLAQTREADALHPIARDVSQEEAEQLLARVDQLSDKEVDSLLREMLDEEVSESKQGEEGSR